VNVSFNQKKYVAYADATGSWEVYLEPANAGKAGDIVITAASEKIELKDILVGEVWICSGQSNMEWKMGMLPDKYKEELKTAENDNIRFVVVNKTFANAPQQDVVLEKKWSPITPATVGNCSAVAYWYAKKLYQSLHVPIGLVVSSWGGTPAQSWTSFEGLHDFSSYLDTYINKIKPLQLNDFNKQKQLYIKKFEQSIFEKIAFVKELVKPDFDDSKWEEMFLPKQWEAQGLTNLDGIVAFRVAFNVTAADAGKEAILNLPAVDDMDSTYINGHFIGTTNQWDALRKYTIPAGVLQAGKNILVIKVQDNGGGGGLSELEEKFNVVVGNTIIPLKGKAKYTIIAVLEDITGGHGDIQFQPAVLYNAMIAPLLPLTIRGVIWYQGESNADDKKSAMEYRTLFPAMITDWRNHWAQGDFPFLYVQLSSFGPLKTQPAESSWALLREAQTTTLTLPNTAMAVTIDIGNPLNIHPQQKKEVGDRLAISALKMVYDQNILCSGPIYKNYTIKGNQVVIEFSNAANGLKINGTNTLKHFAIAGADKKFIWANAVIKNQHIVVSSKLVPNPIAVRYAWADSPVDANLVNKDNLPALPFRTDDW
ncbi:MAG: sialate O-acetylesterase, partial [Ferruginibacter sp.]